MNVTFKKLHGDMVVEVSLLINNYVNNNISLFLLEIHEQYL